MPHGRGSQRETRWRHRLRTVSPTDPGPGRSVGSARTSVARRGQVFPDRSAPATPAQPRSLCARPAPPRRPSPEWSPSHNTDTPSTPVDTRSPPAAALAGYQRSDDADGRVLRHRAAKQHRLHSDPAESAVSRRGHQPGSAKTTPNPAAYPAYDQTSCATSVHSQASSPTAHPTTVAATSSRNPYPTAVPAPRSARPAQRSHDPAQPAPLPTRPHARAPVQATPQPTPEPTPQDHLRPSSHHTYQGTRQLNRYLRSYQSAIGSLSISWRLRMLDLAALGMFSW